MGNLYEQEISPGNHKNKAKLAKTSEATIAISFIVMNLERICSGLLYFLLWCCSMCRIPLRVYAAEDRNRHWDMQIAA